MSTDELFEIPESLSPREKWLRKHWIYTRPDGKGFTLASLPSYTCSGQTERDAIDNLASVLAMSGIPHWTTDPDCK